MQPHGEAWIRSVAGDIAVPGRGLKDACLRNIQMLCGKRTASADSPRQLTPLPSTLAVFAAERSLVYGAPLDFYTRAPVDHGDVA